MTTDSENTEHRGGCLCGAVRFAATGAPLWVIHCHCRSCRRQTASAFATFAGFTEHDFAVTHGTMAAYRSSPGVVRRFCRACGTPLVYQSDRFPGEVHIHIGALDDPEPCAPTGHVFTAERLTWVHIADDLPQYRGSSRDGAPGA